MSSNEDKMHKYEYQVDLSEDTAPARVVRMVGAQKRVLEIGPGPGSITKHLKHNNDCRITALELDSEAIKKVSQYCEQVYQADLNNAAWTDLLISEDIFDVVVAADVLEHVYEPLTVLKQMSTFINDDGCIVVSLPHVGHSVIHTCLFDEDFEYRDFGLLDRTHIRFFGIKNIQDLFDNADLKIVQAEYVIRAPEATEFADRWLRLDRDVRMALAKNPFGNVYQVVVKAVPKTVVGQELSLTSIIPEGHVSASWQVRVKAAVRPYLSHSFRSRIKRLAGFLKVKI